MERVKIISELIGETFGRFDSVNKVWKSEGIQEAYELEAWELIEKLGQKGYYIVKAPASIVKKIDTMVADEDRDAAEAKLIERIREN